MADQAQARENLPVGVSNVILESMQFNLVEALDHIEGLYTNDMKFMFHKILKYVCRYLYDYDYSEKEVDQMIPLGTLQINFAIRVWQQVFGHNGPESPWKKIQYELSEDELGHCINGTECKDLLQDALEADEKYELIEILARGYRDTEDLQVYFNIQPNSSNNGAATASKQKLETQLSAEMAKNQGLKAEIRELKTKLSSWKTKVSVLNTQLPEWKTDLLEWKTELSELKADLSWLRGELMPRQDSEPEGDEGTKKKRKVVELTIT